MTTDIEMEPKKHTQLTYTCPLCASQSIRHIYSGPIRSGIVGTTTRDEYKVLQCNECHIAYLSPFPAMEYESEEYRDSYNSSSQVSDYFKLHDHQQAPYLQKMQEVSWRNKVVGDFGCGGGAFLDQIKGLAKKTIAIEPFTGYHNSLQERGHQVYQFGVEYLASPNRIPIDVAVSLHVIEHVSSPLEYLKEIYNVLSCTGVAYIATPNLEDFLVQEGAKEYLPFFYRTAHMWYFNAQSLSSIATKAGFTEVQISYQHNYDLSNAICWLRDGRPTGLGKLKCFNNYINSAWRNFLENEGLADVIWARLRR